jgi:hypothetical protein
VIMGRIKDLLCPPQRCGNCTHYQARKCRWGVHINGEFKASMFPISIRVEMAKAFKMLDRTVSPMTSAKYCEHWKHEDK